MDWCSIGSLEIPFSILRTINKVSTVGKTFFPIISCLPALLTGTFNRFNREMHLPDESSKLFRKYDETSRKIQQIKDKNSDLYRAFNVIIREAIQSTTIASSVPGCFKKGIHQAILRAFLSRLIDMSKSRGRAPDSFLQSLKELGSKDGALEYIMRNLGVENDSDPAASASEPEGEYVFGSNAFMGN